MRQCETWTTEQEEDQKQDVGKNTDFYAVVAIWCIYVHKTIFIAHQVVLLLLSQYSHTGIHTLYPGRTSKWQTSQVRRVSAYILLDVCGVSRSSLVQTVLGTNTPPRDGTGGALVHKTALSTLIR